MGNASFADCIDHSIHVYQKIAVISIHYTECGQEDDRIRRCNSVLEGINRIFSSIVNAETEEELGNACLSVALEITGSRFGFVGEVWNDGLLHDIAISDMGWEQCTMYDKTGHRRPPGDFVLHGLYGSVIDNAKSFFTNDPSSHPDSIGLPQGHPPLTSFLGVPLILDGKVKGILAVANRKNGYSLEQQQDLEAIAPAVIQSLRRKREEQEHIRADEALQESENLFRTLFEYTDDAFQIVELIFENGKVSDFRYLQTNAAFENQSGLKSSEVVGKTVKEVMPNVDPYWFEMYSRVIKEGRPLRDANYNQDTKRWYEMFYFPYGEGKVGVLFRDITDKKRAEEALHESEELYRSLFEKTQDSFLLVEPIFDEMGNSDDYYILRVNDSWERQTGFRAVDFVGKRIRDVMPNVENYWPATFAEVARTSTAKHFENYNANSGKWYDLHTFPFRKGQVGVLFRDITERKRAEKTLLDSEQQLRLATQAAGMYTWELDIATGEIRFSGDVKGVIGFSYTEYDDVFSRIEKYTVPEDGARHREALQRTMRGEGDLHSVNRVVNPETGEIIWMETHATLVCANDGTPLRIVGIAQNITERKRAEETLKESENKFYRVFYNSPIPMTLSRVREGLWVDANEAYCRLVGYSRDELVGHHSEDFNLIDQSERDRLAQIVLEKGSLNGVEVTLRNKSEKYLVVLYYIKKIFLHGIEHSIATVVDITERKRIEEALRESEIKYRTLSSTLEEKVKERTEELKIAYNSLKKIETIRKKEIHHRIKNNLQIISSLLDLQAEKFNNRECIKDSEVLEAFKESQNRVISMALIHEELHRGGEIDSLNFSQYIEELADNLFLTYRFGSGNIILDMDIEENIFFDMDTSIPLGIIVNELVSNSLKHAFSGRENGEIKIKLHRDESKECRETISEDCKSTNFTLTISDNGVGIPEELDIGDLDSLGFQLIISLVDQLDGEFELKRNNGTEFTMKFAVVENKNQALESQQLADL